LLRPNFKDERRFKLVVVLIWTYVADEIQDASVKSSTSKNSVSFALSIPDNIFVSEVENLLYAMLRNGRV